MTAGRERRPAGRERASASEPGGASDRARGIPERSERRPAGKGQVTVEFALLLPVVVLVALAVIQMALVARDQLAVVHAAREAARAASVDPDPGAAEAAAHRTLPDAGVEVTERGEVGDEISVVVAHISRTDLPLVGPLIPDVTQVARATMRIEQ